MTDPFAQAFADAGASLELAGDAEFVDAVFTPASGDPVPCAVRLYKEDSMEPDGLMARVTGEMTVIEYERADISRDAVPGETFTVGSTVYTVKGVRDRDSMSIRVLVI